MLSMLLAGLFMSACTQKNQQPDHADESMSQNHPFVAPIEKAHKMKAWKTKGALKSDLSLQFGNQPPLNATLMVETNGPGIRLEISQDTVAVFDGQQMWSMPSDSAVGPFELKTWAYFLKAPYKLDDPGTHIAPQGSEQMRGTMYDKAKLKFDAGTGDSPDDWYILYRNQKTKMLHGFAYIVTYGRTVKEAEKHPHAITYDEVKKVDGVPIATTWKFWTWSKDDGFSDQPIGHARLKNIEFVKTGSKFSKPAGAMKMKHHN